MDFETLAHHVRTARRAPDDRAALGVLLARCWPGGGDRLEPAAARWVSRWGPSRMTVDSPDCGCAAGRCGVCN